MPSILYDYDVYLDPIVTGITWSGDITQAYRTLEIRLKNTVDGVSQAVTIELGRALTLFGDDGTELFRGVIFKHDIDQSGAMTVTAYDENVYLTKNTDTRKFRGMTASGIIRQLCGEFGIPIGTIAETDYVISRLILRDKTLFEMMTTALTETRRQTGRRFWVYAKNGTLNLTERGDKVVDWVIENGVNLTGASYGQSIEDMRNIVKVTANEDATPSTTANYSAETLDMIGGTVTTSSKSPISAIARDDTLVSRYGMMQHVEHADSDATQSSADQLARETLSELSKIKDEAKVDALGNVEITAGSAVYVIESMTRIVGGFYVITDSHTWENGVHKMSLTVSGDESLPTLKYEELASETTEKTKKSSGGLTAAESSALKSLDSYTSFRYQQQANLVG